MADEVLSQEEIDALIAGAGPDQSSGSSAEAAAAADQSPTIEVHGGQAPTGVRPAEYAPVNSSVGGPSRSGVDLILDVQLQVSVELGRSVMPVRDVLAIGPGSVVELEKHAGEPVEVVVNNKTIARGEVVVIDENFGVRITEIVNGSERNSRAKAA